MSCFPIVAAGGHHLDDDRLIDALGRVPDPRARRGVRYALGGMLAVAISAVIAGACSFTAIGEWGAELDAAQLARLGLVNAPVESTLRKLFARLDAAALDAALSRWTRRCRCGRGAGPVRWPAGG